MIDMKYNINGRKLRTLVDELGEEYKDLLIERVLEDTNELDIDRISPSELMRTDIEIKSYIQNNKRMQKTNRVYKLIAIMGLFYVFIGLMLMMSFELDRYYLDNPIMRISYVMIFIGLFVSISAILLRFILKTKPTRLTKKRAIRNYEVISKWKEIEALLYQLTPQNEKFSLSAMITYLKKSNLFTQDEIDSIFELLDIRNKILHSQNEVVLSENETREMLLSIDKIVAKMKNICE